MTVLVLYNGFLGRNKNICSTVWKKLNSREVAVDVLRNVLQLTLPRIITGTHVSSYRLFAPNKICTVGRQPLQYMTSRYNLIRIATNRRIGHIWWGHEQQLYSVQHCYNTSITFCTENSDFIKNIRRCYCEFVCRLRLVTISFRFLYWD